jgi:hypothetical protein
MADKLTVPCTDWLEIFEPETTCNPRGLYVVSCAFYKFKVGSMYINNLTATCIVSSASSVQNNSAS